MAWRSKFLIIFCLLLVSGRAFSSTLLERAYDRGPDPDGQEDFSRLTQIIKSSRAKTIDALLPHLPEAWRRRQVLAFGSRSLQAADLMRPRVLLITPRAHLIMAFNGEPSQRGFESLETIRFTQTRGHAEFILESIEFSEDRRAREAVLAEQKDWANFKDLKEISSLTRGENPSLCLQCHRQNPRPNWAHYSFWPGFYGQNDDQPFLSSKLGPNLEMFVRRDPETGVMTEVDNDAAADALPKFIAKAKTMPRYRHLLNLDWQLPNDANDLTSKSYSVPLAALTYDLTKLNTLRILEILGSTSEPEQMRARFLWALWDCDQSESQEGRVDDSQPMFYENIKRQFATTRVPWEDFFMDFMPGPGNRLISPGSIRAEATYLFVQSQPDLLPLFEVKRPREQNEPKDRIETCQKLKTRAHF